MEINFILVEPKVPENIGASARALKTMGFSTLKLVNPCKDPEGKALWLAHGSHDILDSAEVYHSLEEAIEGSDLVIASTARKRALQKDIIDASELRDFLVSRKSESKTISLVFGREEAGLSSDEMKLCDIATSITMAGNYPSLNLSQSVMIYAYELSGENRSSTAKPDKREAISDESLRTLKVKANKIFDETGIAKNKNLHGRILERMGHLSDSDIKLLHSVSKSVLTQIKREDNIQ